MVTRSETLKSLDVFVVTRVYVSEHVASSFLTF